MELPIFFRSFFPLATLDELREETFALYYFSEGGVKYGDVLDMESDERRWNLRRIEKQKALEAEAIERARQSAKRRR